MKNRTKVVLSLVVISLMAMSLFGCAAPAPKARSFTISSASVGSTCYVAGLAIGDVLKKYADIDVQVVPVAGGYVKTREVMDNAENDMCMNSPFNYIGFTPQRPVYFLIPTHLSYTFCLVPEDSPAQSVADLKGLRVSSTKGGMAPLIADMWFEAEGLDMEKDVDLRPMSDTEMYAAIKDGTIDALVTNIGCPHAATMELASKMDIRFIPMPEHVKEFIFGKYPGGFAWVNHPTSVYQGVDTDEMGAANLSAWFADERMSEQDAYDIVYNWLTHWEEGAEAAAVIKGAYALEGVLGAAVPSICSYHPGAVRAHKDAGIELLK